MDHILAVFSCADQLVSGILWTHFLHASGALLQEKTHSWTKWLTSNFFQCKFFRFLLRTQHQGRLLHSLHSPYNLPTLKIFPSALTTQMPFHCFFLFFSFVNYKSAKHLLAFICPCSHHPPKVVLISDPPRASHSRSVNERRSKANAKCSLKGQMCFVPCWLLKCQGLCDVLGWFKVCV